MFGRGFDAVGAFTKAFTPTDGGYLYYTSPKAGGRLVTTEEFELLVNNFRKLSGFRGMWKMVLAIILPLTLWTLLSTSLALPEWADQVVTAIVPISLAAWLLWASFAPRRLVQGRPIVAPPRPIAQSRRIARDMLSWPLMSLAIIFTGGVFVGCLSDPNQTVSWWAWTIGSGAMFAMYLWISIQKLRDMKR